MTIAFTFKKEIPGFRQTLARTLNYVSASGRTNEIRLTKIWKDLRGLNFPSFYLELMVIDALKGRMQGQLASNFWEVLRFLCQDFIGRIYYDPANTNNRISDDLTAQERQAIATAACQSRQQQLWTNIVW